MQRRLFGNFRSDFRVFPVQSSVRSVRQRFGVKSTVKTDWVRLGFRSKGVHHFGGSFFPLLGESCVCVACLLVPLLLCGRGVSRVLAAGGEGFPFPSRFSSRSIEGPRKKSRFVITLWHWERTAPANVARSISSGSEIPWPPRLCVEVAEVRKS